MLTKNPCPPPRPPPNPHKGIEAGDDQSPGLRKRKICLMCAVRYIENKIPLIKNNEDQKNPTPNPLSRQ